MSTILYLQLILMIIVSGCIPTVNNSDDSPRQKEGQDKDHILYLVLHQPFQQYQVHHKRYHHYHGIKYLQISADSNCVVSLLKDNCELVTSTFCLSLCSSLSDILIGNVPAVFGKGVNRHSTCYKKCQRPPNPRDWVDRNRYRWTLV